MSVIQQNVVVLLKQGLHMRPGSDFVELARTFQSDIKIAKSGKAVDAKRILGIMNLGVKKDEEITLTAEGEDAHSAVEALAAFVQSEVYE
jgi:phosphotransferase system HPr (HPr) family protein